MTHLEQSKTVILRATPTYYTHHIVRQGYTQRGQVVGAGIGPGSNSQYLGADLFGSWGRIGGFFERRVFDNDALFAIVGTSRNFSLHDVGLTFGGRSEWFVGDFTAGAGLSYSRELNRYYIFKNDVNNWRGQFSLQWNLPRLGLSVIP